MIKYKDNVEDWLERIEDALEYRRLYGREEVWGVLEAMYANLPNSGAEVGPNLIQEHGDILVARLGVGSPAVGISPAPTDPSSVETYPLVQALDNWLMIELNIPEIIRDVILHAFLWGRGIVKIGYDSEWGFDESFDLGTIAEPWGFTLSQFTRKGKRLEYGPARPGMPWVAPVLPHDFAVPWGVKYLHQAPWVAHRVVRHIDLLKADPKYEKTRDLQPSLSMRDVVSSYYTIKSRNKLRGTNWDIPNISAASARNEYVELWEVRNYITERIVTLSDSAIHRNAPDIEQVDGLPFKSMTFMEHPRTFWTTPQADYLLYHQAEQTDIAIQSAKQRRINVLKYLVREGTISQDELTKALSADVGVAAFMRSNAQLRNDLILMPQASNQQNWMEAEASRRNAREAMGLSRNQLGEFDSGTRRTAREATIVQAGAETRMDRRGVAVADLYTELFRFINQVIFTRWKTPRVVRVDETKWPRFTGEDIRAEYSYEVSFGQTRPKDQESRRNEAFNLYLALRQDPAINQVELRNYLGRVFGDVELERIFVQEPQGANLSLPMPGVPQ